MSSISSNQTNPSTIDPSQGFETTFSIESDKSTIPAPSKNQELASAITHNNETYAELHSRKWSNRMMFLGIIFLTASLVTGLQGNQNASLGVGISGGLLILAGGALRNKKMGQLFFSPE